MRQETIYYFTDKEEEFVKLLNEIGLKNNVAKMLVFLANKSPATSRDIERGTDLRQPEVSMAIKYLAEQNWLRIEDIPSKGIGRPCKNYSLAIPFEKIIVSLEKQKKAEANNQLALVSKIKNFIR